MKNLHITNPFFNSPVIYYDEVSSTMDTARSLYPDRVPGGSVITAAYQTQGRGRGRGRKWEASKGSSLLFTLIMEIPALGIPVYHAPVAAGLAVCRFLEDRYTLSPVLKWPNDILIASRKISGILCEASGQVLYTGIGLNCNQREYRRYRDLNIESTSLCLETEEEGDINPLEILADLLPYLYSLLISPSGNEQWMNAAEQRLYMRNAEVQVRKGGADSDHIEKVRILGLSEEGGLRLQSGNGVECTCLAGEILYPGYTY